jgi:hypothetical protein
MRVGLLRQMEDGRAQRKDRMHIGMNETERKLNCSALHTATLERTAGGSGCTDPVCVQSDHCSCEAGKMALLGLTAHAPSRNPRAGPGAAAFPHAGRVVRG